LKKVIISIDSITLSAELADSDTANAVFSTLPVEGRVNRWGDEIYFDTPLKMKLEDDARAEVKVGELAYWPSGPALCIFFGPTPVSEGNEPRAFSPVSVFGRITSDCTPLKTVSDGAIISITGE